MKDYALFLDRCADAGEVLNRQKMREAAEYLRRFEEGYQRYEFVRKLAPIYYSQLWNRCMREDRRFDDLVDELRAAK